MVRMLKLFCGLTILGLGVQCASAFSMIGPFAPYQVDVISYQLPSDLGGPQNLGEEYRQNTPVLYYTFNQQYLDYFGSNGVVALEQAFHVYNSLSNVSAYSAELSEWALESQRVNYQAQALGLLDLKSSTMMLLAEQAGLAEPDRYTWTLHDRLVGPGGCPADVSYLVIKRNFDPVFTVPSELQPSSYVNGTLYSYFITEICAGPPPYLADAVEYPVDPLANTFTAVASFGLAPGGYFTGLTRDDVGGLRYLLRTNNMNIENAGVDTVTFVTNNNNLQLLFSSNLTLFASQALTNDAATLIGLYPTLQIAGSTPYFVNVVTTNPVFYFTNFPWDPYGTPAHLATNYWRSTNVETWYNHEFVNVVTNQYLTTSTVQLLTTNISTTDCPPATPYGNVCTNISTLPVSTNLLTGGYYIIPSNFCGVQIVSTQLIATTYVTNTTLVATNAGSTNVNSQFFSQTLVYSWNQYIYQIYPVTCPSNSLALRQGIEKVKYVRRDFDSLLNQFFYPVTNVYTLYAVTNSSLFVQKIQRVVTQPDLLITAEDLATDPGDAILGQTLGLRSIRPNENNALAGLNGPGTLDPGNVFTYNKVGPAFVNFTPNFLTEATQARLTRWGTFDGSTNAPVVYPNGTDIINLENQVLIQISPAGPALPNGNRGVNYTNAFSGFTVTGGTAPYNWTVAPGSPALPWGLTLNAANGKISGVPLQSGIYDFTIRLTDAGARYVDRPYSMTITP